MSDVYSFGVVLLELITGRRSVDKTRPAREQNLADYARPMLNEPRKLEGQYSEAGARKAAALAYQCLSHRPKHRPTMSVVVATLEPLTDFDDAATTPFVYFVPADKDDSPPAGEETAKRKDHRHHNHPLHHSIANANDHSRQRMRSPRSPENGTAARHAHRNGLNSPLHPRTKRTYA